MAAASDTGPSRDHASTARRRLACRRDTGAGTERRRDARLLPYRPEVVELDLGAEQALCEAVGVTFVSFPISDRGAPPSITWTRELIERLHTAVAEGRTVAVHCRTGIGRVSVVAACVLLRAGMNVDDAFAEIERARGLAVPDTPQQREWVVTFA